MAKICPNCGKQNKDAAKFCEDCGTTLSGVADTFKQDKTQKSEQKTKPAGIIDQIKRWWNARDTKGKAVTGVGMCCLGLIILVAIAGALSPDKNTITMELYGATYDSPGEYHVEINNSTTEYVISGHVEPETNLTVSSTDLNISAQRVNLTSNNSFQYKVNIPANVNEAKVRFDAEKLNKTGSYIELTIKRPSPPASTPTTNTTPTTSTPSVNTPKTVTIAQLYGSSIAEGTYVKVSGKVLQSDGYNLRIENSNMQDIMVQGSDLTAYEDQKVTVVGTYNGPTSYETVMGGERTVPNIINAEIVK